MKIEELDQSEEWKKSFLEFAQKPTGFILFAGKNGTGKTFASETIFNNVRIWQHEEKMFFTQTDLNMRWTADVKQWGEASYLCQRLYEAKVLVLDDIGTRTPSEPFKDFIYAVIEKRERSKDTLGTILTTNLNSAEMREMFGDAIVSRIASGKVFRFEGPDRRFKEF